MDDQVTKEVFDLLHALTLIIGIKGVHWTDLDNEGIDLRVNWINNGGKSECVN